MHLTPNINATDAIANRVALRRRLVVAAALASLLTIAAAEVSVAPFRGRAELVAERYDFRLQDPSGRWYTMADFRGRVVLFFFGYTQCPDACPTELARMARLMERLGPDAARVKVLFATLDPERDTPDVMQAYPAMFNANFLGLRGSPENTLDLATALKVYFEKIPGRTPTSYTIDHSTFVYGFDSQGFLRVRLTPSMSADDVYADVRGLLNSR